MLRFFKSPIISCNCYKNFGLFCSVLYFFFTINIMIIMQYKKLYIGFYFLIIKGGLGKH